MKRILLAAGLLSLLVVASACGGGGSKQVTLPGDNGNVKVTSGGSLPSDFPSDFPIFSGANLTTAVTGEQGGESGNVVTWETDASADDVTNFYKGALDKDPWTTSGTFSSGQGSVITFARTDGKDLGGEVTVSSSSGKTEVIVFMGKGTGIGATAEAGQGEQATATPKKGATPEEAATPAQAELPAEVQLPKDYPTDVAPIPSGARVTEATSYTSGGQTSFTVQCLTKQDPQSVADFYSSKVPGNGWTEASTGSTSGQLYANYTNEASGGNLVITMSPSQDYAGYTEVDIILTTGQ